MQSIITLTQQTRNLLKGSTKNLSPEQWLAMPEKFDNNIAWNVGHIIAVQQSLFYRLSGLKTYTDKSFVKMYNQGTSPADWAEQPDPAELIALLDATTASLQADFDNGVFVEFRPFSTSTGLSVNTIEESAAFNLYHEGLHLGAILSIKNLL